MEKIAFMTNYHEVIDEQQTIRIMKQHLKFLAEYTTTLETKNMVKEGHQDEWDVINYLPYTRSILYQNNKKSPNEHSTRVLEAIERRDQYLKQNQKLYEERKQHYHWLMNGIAFMDDSYQRLLIDKYVRRYENQMLCSMRNHISLSTLNRQVNKACLKLAQLLELEVLK